MKQHTRKLFTIIDDDQDDRELFLDAISEITSDVICHAAGDPEEFLANLNSLGKVPDVIFLDINMPRVDGYQFLSLIRKDCRFNNTKIVMYSTSINNHDKARAKSLGANDFITKPTTYNELCKALRNFVDEFPASTIAQTR